MYKKYKSSVKQREFFLLISISKLMQMRWFSYLCQWRLVSLVIMSTDPSRGIHSHQWLGGVRYLHCHCCNMNSNYYYRMYQFLLPGFKYKLIVMLYVITKMYSIAFNNVISTIIYFILYNPSFQSHTTHFPKAHGTRVKNTGLE